MRISLVATAAALLLAVCALSTANAQSSTPAVRGKEQPSLTIYHIEGRRSQRVVWLCEEIGLPYTLSFKRGDLLGSMQDIMKVSPLIHVAPTVRYGDVVMVESGAILEYLLSQRGHGKLAPAVNSPDYPYYLMWLHFAEGSAMPRLLGDLQRMALTGGKVITPDVHPVPTSPGHTYTLVGTQDVMKFIEEFLSKHPYFGGSEFSAADIMMHFVAVMASKTPGVDMADYPHFAAWRKTVESRPAFVRANAAALPDGHSPDDAGVQGPQAK